MELCSLALPDDDGTRRVEPIWRGKNTSPLDFNIAQFPTQIPGSERPFDGSRHERVVAV